MKHGVVIPCLVQTVEKVKYCEVGEVYGQVTGSQVLRHSSHNTFPHHRRGRQALSNNGPARTSRLFLPPTPGGAANS